MPKKKQEVDPTVIGRDKDDDQGEEEEEEDADGDEEDDKDEAPNEEDDKDGNEEDINKRTWPEQQWVCCLLSSGTDSKPIKIAKYAVMVLLFARSVLVLTVFLMITKIRTSFGAPVLHQGDGHAGVEKIQSGFCWIAKVSMPEWTHTFHEGSLSNGSVLFSFGEAQETVDAALPNSNVSLDIDHSIGAAQADLTISVSNYDQPSLAMSGAVEVSPTKVKKHMLLFNMPVPVACSNQMAGCTDDLDSLRTSAFEADEEEDSGFLSTNWKQFSSPSEGFRCHDEVNLSDFQTENITCSMITDDVTVLLTHEEQAQLVVASTCPCVGCPSWANTIDLYGLPALCGGCAWQSGHVETSGLGIAMGGWAVVKALLLVLEFYLFAVALRNPHSYPLTSATIYIVGLVFPALTMFSLTSLEVMPGSPELIVGLNATNRNDRSGFYFVVGSACFLFFCLTPWTFCTASRFRQVVVEDHYDIGAISNCEAAFWEVGFNCPLLLGLAPISLFWFFHLMSQGYSFEMGFELFVPKFQMRYPSWSLSQTISALHIITVVVSGLEISTFISKEIMKKLKRAKKLAAKCEANVKE